MTIGTELGLLAGRLHFVLQKVVLAQRLLCLFLTLTLIAEETVIDVGHQLVVQIKVEIQSNGT
jgi:hypothetical protein